MVRQVSRVLTPLLLRLPVSANQVTAASMVSGLAAGWFMLGGDVQGGIVGAVLLVLCYGLDNSDGEIARLRNQCSEFGRHFDTFADWIVHTAFFAALGVGVAGSTGQNAWMWLGWIAAAGGTINYALGIILEIRESGQENDETAGEGERSPETWSEWGIFVFRELFRADFCFIVLGLALFDLTWLLLPAGAIGAQVYWVLLFVRAARKFHA
jgi:phosphatidylglycerophosphate synthase